MGKGIDRNMHVFDEKMWRRCTDVEATDIAMPPTGTYQLLIHVIEARDLAAKDRGGTSDPVVKCTLSPAGASQSTTIKHKDCNPCWDETLELDVHPDDDVLLISVWCVVEPFTHRLP